MTHTLKTPILTITLLFFTLSLLKAQNKDLKLWYDQPAARWTEALPVGNGALGAMIFGNPQEEVLQLNEATFWSGGPVSKANVNLMLLIICLK